MKIMCSFFSKCSFLIL
uniref:Uncharacterized protein n=1 Tax=Arundo donax TaxID=35708 RepID=A0A0A9HLG2_ARUDO